MKREWVEMLVIAAVVVWASKNVSAVRRVLG